MTDTTIRNAYARFARGSHDHKVAAIRLLVQSALDILQAREGDDPCEAYLKDADRMLYRLLEVQGIFPAEGPGKIRMRRNPEI